MIFVYLILLMYCSYSDLWLPVPMPDETMPSDIKREIGEKIYAGKNVINRFSPS